MSPKESSLFRRESSEGCALLLEKKKIHVHKKGCAAEAAATTQHKKDGRSRRF